MREYAEYIDNGEYIMLYRLHAAGSIAEIPAEISGKPVRALADHIFADEPSVMYERTQIKKAALSCQEKPEPETIYNGAVKPARTESSDGADDDGDAALREDADSDTAVWEDADADIALRGADIEIVRIPEGVESIGNYAFYGCRNLKEVHFPSTLKRIGYGMFNVCQKLSRLYFNLGTSQRDTASGQASSGSDDTSTYSSVTSSPSPVVTPPMMKEVLDAVSLEVEAVVTCNGQEQWRLLFPEYYEEGEENTPARIIVIVYHGTGHQYRNCFLNRKVQFDRYDEVFPLAKAQESTQTNIRLILDRLGGGPEPDGESKGRYIDYLRSVSDPLLGMINDSSGTYSFDTTAELRKLDNYNFYTSNIIDDYIRKLSEAGRADAVSLLMDIKRNRFGLHRAGKYEL